MRNLILAMTLVLGASAMAEGISFRSKISALNSVTFFWPQFIDSSSNNYAVQRSGIDSNIDIGTGLCKLLAGTEFVGNVTSLESVDSAGLKSLGFSSMLLRVSNEGQIIDSNEISANQYIVTAVVCRK